MIKIDWKAIDLNQKPNQRERIIFALSLLIFFGVFVRSCWLPSRKVISEVKTQLSLIEKEKRMRAELKGVLLPLARPSSLVPLPSGLVGSVKEMEAALGRLSEPQVLKGVRILKSRFSEVEREGNLVRRGVELELLGSFQGLGRYLHTLESMKAPLWIEAFSIKAGSDKLSAEVRGSVYGME